jgi:ankyrin repeat protein
MPEEKTTALDAARTSAWQTVEQLRTEWAAVAKAMTPAPAVTAPLSFPANYDRTNVTQVCQYQDIDTLRVLLVQRPDILTEKDGTLEMAAINGNTEMARLLLDHGVDIHRDNDIALVLASHNHHIETVYLLIERGAPLENLTHSYYDAYIAYKNEREIIIAHTRKTEQEQVIARHIAVKTLSQIFNVQTWVGHVTEMRALWQQVPPPLQATLDFSHLISEVKLQTIKQKPQKPKITVTK